MYFVVVLHGRSDLRRTIKRRDGDEDGFVGKTQDIGRIGEIRCVVFVGRSSPAGMDGAPGSTGSWGVCHSFTEDGRCVSLFKIMLTNFCIYDCAYCINRRRNDRPRTMLSTAELVGLTMEFYRRNYIEGFSSVPVWCAVPIIRWSGCCAW